MKKPAVKNKITVTVRNLAKEMSPNPPKCGGSSKGGSKGSSNCGGGSSKGG